MAYYMLAIGISVLSYILIIYLTYLSAFLLFKGITYRLIIPTIKSSLFFITCYTFIIADLVMLRSHAYLSIIQKDIVFILLVVLSLHYTRKERNKPDEGK